MQALDSPHVELSKNSPVFLGADFKVLNAILEAKILMVQGYLLLVNRRIARMRLCSSSGHWGRK